MEKVIISVVGKDSVGTIANVCTYLAQTGINVLNITQTIVDGYFNMMMIVNAAEATKDFQTIADDTAKLGKELGVQILAQRSEIFDMMHRV